MRLLYFLADSFIDTFGITHPTEKGRRQAAWFIGGLMALMFAGLGIIALVGLRIMGQR